MADDADIAQRNIEIQLANQIKNARTQSRVMPDIQDGKVYCLNCGECLGVFTSLETARRFCDAECRDDWAKENPNR